MGLIDGYHMMVISQYFSTFVDFISLEFVCKKFNTNMLKFHHNLIPLTTKTIKFFSKIETLNIWSKNNETFSNMNFRVIPSNHQDNIDFFALRYGVQLITTCFKR
ncbi:hypothetical protein EIN_521670 [Entamoeba invadens IP1]|uniref:Uncharacterized protein n=1 Tax=Entamoeba invadens IP1 TaxID=370355 RepID=A0A0A1UD84_ENTIV|nr:hypothetical protein EIN_521670 [Entamoeba invadens IP1]ELP91740.1 hypothetical protein EIN_521670 [Entamoeba invadens IP1]|eukprot:XP_004258511.1 hypothetical protein EIN_521670 [Entamoeba invadens IP1]